MYKDVYENWLNNPYIKDEDKEILKNMTEEEIEESFSKSLEFGTAGIRGKMGLGPSKMNTYTIGKVTVGLANYLKKKYKRPSVVIAFDTRHNSKRFAYETCLILNYYKIKTYLFTDYTSTPELSFAVKKLKCKSGIVITSSHNSKEYNGYKVYNEHGGQVIYPEDDEILHEINLVHDFSFIKFAEEDNKYFNIVDNKIHKAFLMENTKAVINKGLLKKYIKDLRITYTSFHGVGLTTMEELFDIYNIKYKENYNLVKEQCKCDPNFTTCPNPNPEIISNFDLSIKYAKDFDSDVIIASDPDADRIGVMIKENGEYRLLNGNLVGILFTYYVVSNKRLKKDNYIVRSLPTSYMVDEIAKKYNIRLIEVLTGCKNIAFQKFIDPKNYLFGFEESLGYVFNIDVNDKNSFSSTLVFLEILCYCKKNGITISEYIENMYDDIGYFKDYSTSIEYDGIDSMDKMQEVMRKLRCDEIKFDITKEKIDYAHKKGILRTNAIKYIFENDSVLIVRPSGTEPKIKLYFMSKANLKAESEIIIESIKKQVLPLFK